MFSCFSLDTKRRVAQTCRSSACLRPSDAQEAPTSRQQTSGRRRHPRSPYATKRPLTRPAPADENAGSGPPSPQGGGLSDYMA